MEHDLAGFFPDIKHKLVAFAPVFFCQFFCNFHKMSDDALISFFKICDGRDVFFRNEENMHPRFWMDVVESEAVFVFMPDGSGNFPFYNFAENAIVHEFTLAPRPRYFYIFSQFLRARRSRRNNNSPKLFPYDESCSACGCGSGVLLF